jgi:hypothetical protein
MSDNDIRILRNLAEQYVQICSRPAMEERRDLWRRHNSLQRTRPLIYVRAFAWQEMPESKCRCQDPLYCHYEDFFRQSLFRDTFDDDFIFEPWVTVLAVSVAPPEGVWGLPVPRTVSDEPRGSYVWDPPIKAESDAAFLVEPHHVIDEAETERRLDKLHGAIGDIITINVDRAPIYRMWNGDISTQLAYLRGLEQLMWDMMDRPAWLHQVLAFMRDGILQTHEEAESAGDWSLSAHQNQAMPYAEELCDPAPNSVPVSRAALWYFAGSQETTAVGPKQFDEFMLQYQLPILEKFGLIAYGCCEDLTRKIDVLRQIPNLRRIAVSPMADVARCAAQIGQDYVLSYRPNPSEMVGYGFKPNAIRETLKRDLEACGDCHVDITLKDVETVQGDGERVRRWVGIAREIAAAF